MATSQTDSANYPHDGNSEEDEYVRLVVQHQGLLFAYLRTLLNSPVDAEEVLQETCVILWCKRGQFVRGTNFVKWATTIAQYTVRNFRRARKHIPQALNDELLDQISAEMAAELVANSDFIETRQRALAQCMEILSDRDRHLINTTYDIKSTKKDLSLSLGMTPNGFYKTLNRIHLRLQKCIQYRLLAEGRA